MEMEEFCFTRGGISMVSRYISQWELLPSKHTLLLWKQQKYDNVSMQRIKRELENWREWKRKGVINWNVVAVRWVESRR